MIRTRPSDQRGKVNLGWLDSRHSFSFGSYYDPAQMGFRSLRVINQDVVLGGGGFDEHGHADMEIFSYVLDGVLVHGDSMGNQRPLKAGDVQLMRAGRGVRHSEFNGSATDPVHFLQIWIKPAEKGTDPGYQERFVSDEEKRDKLVLLVSPEGDGGSLSPEGDQGSLLIGQDARIYATILSPGHGVEHILANERHGWVQIVRGTVQINDETILQSGDGAAISDIADIRLKNIGDQEAELLLFDLV